MERSGHSQEETGRCSLVELGWVVKGNMLEPNLQRESHRDSGCRLVESQLFG